MKAIMLMFDTLNRHMLPPYGCDWIHAPNFRRLAEKTVTFDRAYVGSMPCMPARRELQTGRHNFLHRSWGPMEPFDDSMPELLKKNGVYTHIVTDHQHYWEDGGGTYHSRYSSFELIRGQEGDPWKGQVEEPELPDMVAMKEMRPFIRQDWINRQYIREEKDFPQAQTMEKGLEFIRHNREADRWFIQIETFDPHEPFYAPQAYRDLYPHEYDGKHFDWPPYGPVKETKEEVAHVRYEYAALLSMCDHYLGKVLDTMDELDLWKDTMLIVNTDHGYLLGEHDWWAKTIMPFYNEIAHIPLFIWDPRSGVRNERRESLVQTIDLAPTLIKFFGLDIPPDTQGKDLERTIARDEAVREAALFGLHGAHVNVTDGRYVYMRAPVSKDNTPLYNYTLMPTHMRSRFSVQELQEISLQAPFSFTKGVQTMKIRAAGYSHYHAFGTLLYDLQKDPYQQEPLTEHPDLEQRMIGLMKQLMAENDAPAEQYARLGIL
ncbi:Arylsulfatase A [Paenibacillus sp. UNCCL117]|uniref:sulfatase n=1 Tax=unclassified Paenibacillus TaxID=185978 RepID=UPI00088D9BE2|nr:MULTISPECIES: sulfatase [unclassified Paenibacillus]SDD04324.1 Arylsulfatase A [Paenibacillus sp. cl123]SFW32105.1 Arylsulfatase A [Paenibacillus sp. UNCCL117]